MTINSKKKMRQQENYLLSAHKIVLKCLYLARAGRLVDILLSVNKPARAITKWTRACDKRFGTFDLVHSSHK